MTIHMEGKNSTIIPLGPGALPFAIASKASRISGLKSLFFICYYGIDHLIIHVVEEGLPNLIAISS